ncbi:pPIWI_RE module domain-containing protein [Umezakia ovalisporum]|jgi:hypothetical protein|uniref:DUF3962 domain-containing protein n=1 Tax=Umezakia ovalisporum FSS-62 TaxID=2971776 RepID=A0AA43H186_9CYAN|nr:DUF3962 domain-containing protein [Umezakia ovalisporum]MDH6065365.1 DUF3962 domain-containing protein [Umezakia ovalisporum FSS-62]MDH6087036.1 DUF3962 domain-containing protein [Umezakia ovalisporum Ak1311]
MAFKIILPGAWELTKDEQYELFSLHVPTVWQQVAKTLAQKRVKLLGRGYPSVPVYSLEPIMAASFPRIIQTVRNGWQRPGVPWILATERAELFNLPDLIKDWLREEFSYCLGDDEVESILNKLDDNVWEWDKKSTVYPLLLPPNNPHKIDIRWQAIPDYLAGEFLKNPQVTFGWDNQYQLTFYQVVNLKPGAELMSWPPYRVPLIKKKKQVGTVNISFVIHFKLQTVPWRNQPMIYHQLSIRRWMTESMKRWPYRGATALIGDNRRWLDGKKQPFRFIPLGIKQITTQAGREARWPRAISELLKINDSPLPDLDSLASEPVFNWSVFGTSPTGMQAAIAYDSRHVGELPCLPGVSPLDLASLDSAIQNKIEQENLPVRRIGEGMKKTGTSISFWGNVKSRKNLDGLSTPMLRPKIAASATFRHPENSPHTILILWETQKCRDALIEEICKLLSLSPQGETITYEPSTGSTGEETLYQNQDVCLRIRTQHVSDITGKLDVDDPEAEGNNRQQKRITLISKRIHQITSYLPPAEGLSGALVEIKPKKSFFPPESDPKLAVRIGVMQAGYVNQHIHALTTAKKESTHRVQRAVTDLLRQFGILPAPLIDFEKDAIDPNMWLTCFYVLRRTRKTTASNKASIVGLMVRVNPIKGTVQITTPTLFATQGWVSYSAGLGYLLSEKWEPFSDADETTGDISDAQQFSDAKSEQKFLNKFVTDCLRDCLSTSIEEEKHPHVLFMAEAINARKMLTWLQNPQLPANNLPDELKRYMTESEINRLSVVRLRVPPDGEVPVAIAKGSPGSRTNGLFCWQGVCDDEATALYLSMRKQLNTEQGTNTLQKPQSRLDNGSVQAGNPKPLEIAVIHHPGFKRDKLACFIHNLRNRWPYFANQVGLPLPFPLAISAKQYAVSAKDSVESPELEEEEDSFESVD